MSDQATDPFALHTQLRDAGQTPELKGKFEGGEHLWLGMKGATLACEKDANKLTMIRNLRRPNDARPLTYGELVALSGDFYGSAKELFLESPAALPWWKGSNDLDELRKAFGTELEWIRGEQRHERAGYPDNNLTFMWTAKSYLELAENNTAHFGWHNIKLYCECHAQAIEYARAAKVQDASDRDWMRAMFYNGFADHFLTDGFAAGHIRVPRQQLREWATEVGYSGKLAGLLSKVLHDQDGHVEELHSHGEDAQSESEGLRVRNSLGDQWMTRCDGQLFLVKDKTTAPQIIQPVSAVEASLKEIFTAQEKKEAPAGVYAALQHVPFPHPDAPALSEKFEDTSPARLVKLRKSFSWYVKLPFVEASLSEENIRVLFEALPTLMARFRASVKQEYAGSAELQLRLPKPYVEAFERIS